jgi:hypothetical protein
MIPIGLRTRELTIFAIRRTEFIFFCRGKIGQMKGNIKRADEMVKDAFKKWGNSELLRLSRSTEPEAKVRLVRK